MLHRIDGTVNADEELASASAAVEEEVAGPVRQGMEGGIDITTGTAIPSMKGVITVGEEVLDENGAPTGTYNVNGEAAVMSEDEMRSAYDELKARVDEERAVAAERGRIDREAARSEEEYRQQVRVGDDVTFVRDGKRISGRAVMDYDEDSLIVDVDDGARTRSYNVRREEIVAPGNAVEEEETPAVDDNAVQEDDVQTDTGNAPAQAPAPDVQAAWQQQMDEAQRNVDYWEGVKNAGQETAAGMAPAQDSTNGAAPVGTGTDAQNMGQTAAAPAAGNAVDAGEQRASLRRKSYVMREQAAPVEAAPTLSQDGDKVDDQDNDARIDERRKKILSKMGDKYTLSTEQANNGEVFIQNEYGSTTLAGIPNEIFERIGIDPLPFKLTETMGWHVYEHHKSETNMKSVSDAVDFVLSVTNNFDHVRLGRDNSYIFSVEDNRKKIRT